MFLRKLYYLRRALKQQWMKPAELRKLQEKRLKAIVNHVFKYVPFYRKLWKRYKIRPEDIRGIEDLKRLPIITRKTIIRNFNQLIAANYRNRYKIGKVVIRHSSGSSGAPMRMLFDENSWDCLDAIYLRALLAGGYDPSKQLAYYWYEPFERTIYNRLGFMNKIYISCKLPEEEQLKILQRIDPEYIYYFSSILHSISNKMLHDGIELHPKSIITHAEILSNKMRKVIEKAFDAPVFDQYGTVEFNRLAWECEEKIGYHVDADSILIEVVDDDHEPVAAGEMGSIVLTGLINFTFPLVRYKIGDMAIPMSDMCPCGRSLPLIKGIEGRCDDLITLNSGKTLTPKMIIDSLADIREIFKFRVHYKGSNRFAVDLVLSERSEPIFEKVERRLKKLAEEKIKIKLTSVDEISKSERGKRKLVIGLTH